jgi:putative oxidoreductase
VFIRLLRTENERTVEIARILLGFVVFVRGAQGLLGWFGGPAFHDPLYSLFHVVSIPAPLVWLAIITGFFAGAGLIVGLFTRFAAVGIMADTLLGLVLAIVNRGLYSDWSISQGGASGQYCLLAFALALILVVRGAGAFSLDRWLFCRRARCAA